MIVVADGDLLCNVKGCFKRRDSKGMCDMHYSRLRRGTSASDVKTPGSMPFRPRQYFQRLAVLLAEGDDVATSDDEKPTAPWNLLRPKPVARQAWNTFGDALKTTRPDCHREPGKFTDYAEQGEEPEEGQAPFPTAREAAAMCLDCPLLALCDSYAKLDQPTGGVWGGKRYSLDPKNPTGYKGKVVVDD